MKKFIYIVLFSLLVLAPATVSAGKIILQKTGNGAGSIGSFLTCGSTCTEATLTLNATTTFSIYATSSPGSIFKGWGGACSIFGTGSLCSASVGLVGTTSITARFDLSTTTATSTPPSTPARPTVTTDATCGGYIHISWQPVAGANSYKLYRNGSLLSAFAFSPYIDGQLTSGVVYSYSVSAVNSAGESAQSQSASAAASAACEQGITVIAPNGGEIWTAGSTQTISWRSTSTAFAKIELLNGLGVPVTSFTVSSLNQGSYIWNIAATTTPGQYKIRVSCTFAIQCNYSDTSDGFFTIDAPAVTTPAIVAWWKFDENFASTTLDSSGNGNVAALLNGPTTTAGRIGKGIALDGVNDFLQIPLSASLRPTKISVSAWFKTRASSTLVQTIMSAPYNGPAWSYPYLSWLIRLNNLSTIEMSIGRGQGGYSASSFAVPTLIAETWYHVAMTYDGTAIRGYLNGSPIGSVNYPGSIGYGTGPILVGADYGAIPADDYFRGSIDDVRIYDGALSASNIGDIYNGIALGNSSQKNLASVINAIPAGGDDDQKIGLLSFISFLLKSGIINTNQASQAAQVAGSPVSVPAVFPVGGETLVRGKSYTFKWAPLDYASYVKIRLFSSTNSIRTIAEYSANKTKPISKSWTVSSDASPADNYTVEICSTKNSIKKCTYGNQFFVVKSGSPLITLDSPNGGESFVAAGIVTADGIIGEGNATFWTFKNMTSSIRGRIMGYIVSPTGAKTLVDNGSRQTLYPVDYPNGVSLQGTGFVVPNTVAPGQYKLLVEIQEYKDGKFRFLTGDISDDWFTVVSTIVTYPKGGENMVTGDPILIRWTPAVPVSVIEIVSTAENYSFGIYGPKYGNTAPITAGEYTYTVVNTTPAGSYYVRVTPTDGSAQVISKIFTINTINQPSITVISPNGGEAYAVGTIVPINWKYSGTIPSSWDKDNVGNPRVIIDLYRGNGLFVKHLAATHGGGPTYPFDITSDIQPGSDYRVRIWTYSDANYFDESDAPFTISSNTTQPNLVWRMGPMPIQTLIAGALDAHLANYEFDAAQSSEDIRIPAFSIPLYTSAGFTSTNLSNCRLLDGSTSITTGSYIVNPTGTSGSLNKFSIDNTIVVTKGTVKKISLRCSISSGASGEFSWGITADGPISATGVASGNLATVQRVAGEGNRHRISTHGTLGTSLDFTSPQAQMVQTGAANVTLVALRFMAGNEALNLNQIGLRMMGSSQVLNGQSVSLWNGVTKIGEGYFLGTTNSTAVVTLPTPLIIPAYSDVTITVKGSIWSSAIAGSIFSIGYDGTNYMNTRATGLSSGTIVYPSNRTDFYGYPITITPSFPYYYQSMPLLSIDLVAGLNTLTRYSVKNTGQTDAVLPAQIFTMSQQGVVLSGLELRGYIDSSFSQPILSTPTLASSANTVGTSDTRTLTPSQSVVIPVGQTRYLSLVGTVSSRVGTAAVSTAANNLPSQTLVYVGVTPADTTPPIVSISSPTSGSTISGTTVVVSATASDNVGVARVEFYVDPVLKATDAVVPYSYSLDSTTLTNGSHSLTAKAYDAAGNVTTSAPVTVTVNNVTTAPSSITVTSPNGGETWQKGSTKTITWSTSPDITTVDIILQSASQTAPRYVIARGVVNTGMYAWTIDKGEPQYTGQTSDITPGTYFIQICRSAGALCDDSNAPFTITAPTTSTGPVAYWKLDGNASEPIGSNNGTAVSVSYVTAKINTGASLDRTGYIKLARPAVGSKTNFTLAGWFKVPSSSQIDLELYSERNSGNNNPQIKLAVNDATVGNVHFVAKDDAGVKVDLYAGVTNANSNWHHVAVVRNGDVWQLYFDNIKKAEVTKALGTITLDNACIAANCVTPGNSSPNLSFKGIIDEVRVYDRALSATEISSLYGGTFASAVSFVDDLISAGIIAADKAADARQLAQVAWPSLAVTVKPSLTEGVQVRTLKNTHVRAAASLSSKILETKSGGSKGIITSSAFYADGYYWSRVDFTNGQDGWVVHVNLTK